VKPALLIFVAILLAACAGGERGVVLYTSQDQFYAEPVLREFTLQTGIRVQPVFDTESVKTAGLANRLRHEASNPRCDLFWNNEEMHSRILAQEGVFPPEAVQAVGYRTRRLVVNTNLLPLAQAPASLLELTNASWKGKIVLAYPLYGTTSSHFLALRQLWGEESWRRWCEGLIANQAKIVDGNSVVVKLVGAGEAWVGLTDSDDVAAGQRAGLPVAQAPLTGEMLIIPNTICIVRNAQTPEVQRLVNYLSGPKALERLVAVGALEGIEPSPVGLRLNWSEAREEYEQVMQLLQQIFLRT
jgi:iron(III) transport system substrate-binding protein